MPHLLIAGATGKGKSVGINTIIASLLYRMHPRDLKFVIVDPKRVEMNLYASLRDHFLAISPDINESIITSPQNAVVVLKALVEEMQQRFSILAAAGQRNILDYNQRVRDGKIKDKGGIAHRPMPYIVVIIDELADLMMTASRGRRAYLPSCPACPCRGHPLHRCYAAAKCRCCHGADQGQFPSPDRLPGKLSY